MTRTWEVSRRELLRGSGAAIGLPLLEAMLPGVRQASAAGAPSPRPLVWFIFNGGTPDTSKQGTQEGRPGCLRPKSTGADYEITELLQPLADLKQDIMVISDLHNSVGRFGKEPKYMQGDHPREERSLLTGFNPEWAGEPNERVSISVDQVAANGLKAFTAIPSLYLGNTTRYLDAYNPMCWTGPTSPLTATVQPSEAFRQVFGDVGADPGTSQRRLTYRKSVLDYARDATERLLRKVGKADKDRLDQYLTSVRAIEETIAKSAAAGNSGAACAAGAPPVDPPSHPERIKQMLDLIALALQCDRTRVAVFQFVTHGLRFDWLPQPYSDYANWHDDIEHGGGAAQFGFGDVDVRLEAYARGCTWIMERFGALVRRLKEMQQPDGSGSVLDSALLVCTSEFAYGNGHGPEHLPVVLAGRAGGAVRPGRHLVVPEQPIANLWVSMLNAGGIDVTTFGNGTQGLSLA